MVKFQSVGNIRRYGQSWTHVSCYMVASMDALVCKYAERRILMKFVVLPYHMLWSFGYTWKNWVISRSVWKLWFFVTGVPFHVVMQITCHCLLLTHSCIIVLPTFDFCGRSAIHLTFLFKGLFPLRAGRCRWRIAPEPLHSPLKSSGAAYLPRIEKGQKGQRMRN